MAAHLSAILGKLVRASSNAGVIPRDQLAALSRTTISGCLQTLLPLVELLLEVINLVRKLLKPLL